MSVHDYLAVATTVIAIVFWLDRKIATTHAMLSTIATTANRAATLVDQLLEEHHSRLWDCQDHNARLLDLERQPREKPLASKLKRKPQRSRKGKS
jgi:hypothetical protein